MEKEKKMELLEEMLEMDAGTLREDMILSEMDEWDSLSMLSLIVLIDEEFGKTIDSTDIRKLVTVKDILDIMCQ
ncbi:phosphopantetheine-binding protein [Parablautia muri]|uniref:Acyl carrier protein n=1 Tax=Parablautia muri TaxID=2320879 RepID=A0A9X5BF81_9FIRM|nr:acyl carrier protein [Parablautia muri]NBJ92675.1 acyl carrier protein [Parablautia muri]